MSTPTPTSTLFVQIQAVLFTDTTPEAVEAVTGWVNDEGGKAVFQAGVSMSLSGSGSTSAAVTPGRIVIQTPEGNAAVYVGDWIIRDVNGDFRPCKPGVVGKCLSALAVTASVLNMPRSAE